MKIKVKDITPTLFGKNFRHPDIRGGEWVKVERIQIDNTTHVRVMIDDSGFLQKWLLAMDDEIEIDDSVTVTLTKQDLSYINAWLRTYLRGVPLEGHKNGTFEVAQKLGVTGEG